MYGLTGSSTLGLVTPTNTMAMPFTGSAYAGYGAYGIGFGGYGTNIADTEKAKENMLNNYSIYTTQQGLNNKQQAETMAFAQQSQNINALLNANRNDDAVKEYEKLVSSIKATPQYSTYTDAEVRALAQAQYQRATGSNLVDDISQKSSSSFTQGLKLGLPVVGLFESTNSREDLISRVTGTPVSAKDNVAKTFGAMVSGGVVIGGAAAGVTVLKTAAKTAQAAGKTGAITNFINGLSPNIKNAGKVGLIAAGVAAAVGLGATLIRSITGDKTTA